MSQHNDKNAKSRGKDELLVSMRHAGVARGRHWLVHGIDLDIHRGEIVTLIGPNGSGKSTTAKMALKILRPTEGSVAQIPGLRVGYVPQKLNLDRTLPLDVFHMMQLTGTLPKDVLMAALEDVGAAHLVREQVSNLSGGELQRVLLARAVARKPDLLVLDEPLQGVDYVAEVALYQHISEYRERLNCGILLISHDLHMVMAASDLVVCLNGHICCRGRPEEVAGSAAYSELFGHSQRNILVPYHHHIHEHDHNHCTHVPGKDNTGEDET